MTQTHKQLGQAKPAAATNTLLYTEPGTGRTMVTSILACNTGAALTTIRVFLVPSGGSPGADNAMYYDAEIPVGETLASNTVPVLEGAGMIYVYSASGDVTFTASGIEITT